jgi:signal transduction histidine kinase
MISPEAPKRSGEHIREDGEPVPLYPPEPRVLKEDGHTDSVIIRIEVSDNGPGIRPSDLRDSQLFSP